MTVVEIDGIDRTIRNVAELHLKNLTTGLVINLPKPQLLQILDNPTQRRLPGVNAAGYSVFSGSFIKGYDPQLIIGYAQMQPEIISFKLGRKFADATKTIEVSKAFQVTQTGVALDLGIGGFTVNSHLASRTTDNFSEDVTGLVTIGGGATPTVTFDPSLAGDRVTIESNITVTGKFLGAEILETHSLSATLIATTDEIIFVDVPLVEVNVEGASLDFDAETSQLQFFIKPVNLSAAFIRNDDRTISLIAGNSQPRQSAAKAHLN